MLTVVFISRKQRAKRLLHFTSIKNKRIFIINQTIQKRTYIIIKKHKSAFFTYI